MGDIQIGPEPLDRVSDAVTGLAVDWAVDVNDRWRYLELLACLAANIDYQIAAIVAGIPGDKRDWEKIACVLGRDTSIASALVCRADIGSDIEVFSFIH